MTALLVRLCREAHSESETFVGKCRETSACLKSSQRKSLSAFDAVDVKVGVAGTLKLTLIEHRMEIDRLLDTLREHLLCRSLTYEQEEAPLLDNGKSKSNNQMTPRNTLLNESGIQPKSTRRSRQRRPSPLSTYYTEDAASAATGSLNATVGLPIDIDTDTDVKPIHQPELELPPSDMVLSGVMSEAAQNYRQSPEDVNDSDLSIFTSPRTSSEAGDDTSHSETSRGDGGCLSAKRTGLAANNCATADVTHSQKRRIRSGSQSANTSVQLPASHYSNGHSAAPSDVTLPLITSAPPANDLVAIASGKGRRMKRPSNLENKRTANMSSTLSAINDALGIQDTFGAHDTYHNKSFGAMNHNSSASDDYSDLVAFASINANHRFVRQYTHPNIDEMFVQVTHDGTNLVSFPGISPGCLTIPEQVQEAGRKHATEKLAAYEACMSETERLKTLARALHTFARQVVCRYEAAVSMPIAYTSPPVRKVAGAWTVEAFLAAQPDPLRSAYACAYDNFDPTLCTYVDGQAGRNQAKRLTIMEMAFENAYRRVWNLKHRHKKKMEQQADYNMNAQG